MVQGEMLDAVIVPMRTPGGDSYAYVLTDKQELIEKSIPVPPAMPQQGGKALMSLTRWGETKKRIGALLHPCEVKAVIELFKLKQTHLENIYLMSYECEGVFKTREYQNNADEVEREFNEGKIDGERLRFACSICDDFASADADLYFGISGGQIGVISCSEKGRQLAEGVSLPVDVKSDMPDRLREKRGESKRAFIDKMKIEASGADKFIEVFSQCINCRNCMRVCPICYCRQCFFDSSAVKMSPDNYIRRAEKRGALRLPADTILFHLGRMSHMMLSCSKCGVCEDACPMDIPVSQMFIYAAENAQKEFDYSAGSDRNEELPLVVYEEEEFESIVAPYAETFKGE